MGEKHQKLLLGNNANRKCLQAHMQNFFSPSPAIEKKYAESENRALFHTKIKNLSWNRWIYEQMVKKHQKILLHNNARRKCLLAHMQHFFSPSPAIEKKYAESENRAFFHTKTKNLSWNRWIYEPMVAKHQKLILRNNAPCKCLHAPRQHFFRPSPATEKKFAESAFFHTKIKTCPETVEFTSKWGKTPKTTPWQQCHSQVPSGPHATFLQP